MGKTRARLFVAGIVTLLAAGQGRLSAQAPTAAPVERDGVTLLVERLEPIVQASNARAFLDLLAGSADRERMLDFASLELVPTVVHAVVRERDRTPLKGTLPGNGYRLVLDVFSDRGDAAHVSTWRLDVKRVGDGEDAWRIADAERLTAVDNLYRLAIDKTKQYDARDLHIAAEDLDLTLVDGSVFVAQVDLGVTGMVFSGHGRMQFHPAPATERGQVKIFCGAETLDAEFDTVYLRINPGDFAALVDGSRLVQRASVDPRALRRAEDVFREESPKSFLLDLGDLSRDNWTLLPTAGDIVAEVRTRKYSTLTYAKSSAEPEDITLFDRQRHRNIALYPSVQKLARRGRFYSEDELSEYDILHHDISIRYSPDRLWLEGRSQIRLRVRAASLSAITMRLADSLVLQSASSDQLGRLFGIRVRNQHMVVINLPTTLTRDAELTLSLTYSGRVEPQLPEREAVAPEGQVRSAVPEELTLIQPERSLLYSSRTFWYPQGNSSDYATATMRITIPAAYECVGSGALAPGSPELIPGREPAAAWKQYVFDAKEPVRYLAFIVSRFARAETVTLAFDHSGQTDGAGLPPMTGTTNTTLNFAIDANPRQLQRGHDMADRAIAIAQFYESLIGDSPYPSFTIALVESDLPGGHSPGYFAALNQPLPTSPYVWRNDPASFTNFPEFFLAHEIAHQWWGQAVGWRNYHEQWLSEGFAQYFAALYAQHARGDDTFNGVLRQMRRWAIEDSPQGPVYLGYRLGHIRGDGRVFRALVYNKGAVVLHMLRRLMGDEAFFRGLRRYYRVSRFHKVGTDDFRAAMEQECGRPLDRFFEQWIYGSTLPHVRFSYRVDGPDVVLHAEQVGEPFDVPLTVVLEYADRTTKSVVMPLRDPTTDVRIPLTGALRDVEVNKDETLAELVKG